MELVNRHYVMTQVMGKRRVRDYMKLAVWGALPVGCLRLAAPGWWFEFWRELRGKLLGLHNIVTTQTQDLRPLMYSGAISNASVVVGITTHNRAPVLRKAIQSAFDQSFAPMRVEVIDDASTDETPSLRDEFVTISWQRWEPGQGIVRARNHMMLTATEDYYVSLDDDSWFVAGDEIAVAVDYLERHPQAAAVAFDILSSERPQAVPREAPRSVAMFIGCGHVLRLSAVKELGGYAEFPGSYGAEEKGLLSSPYRCRLSKSPNWMACTFGMTKSFLARDIVRQHSSGVCNDLALTLRRVPIGLVLFFQSWRGKHQVSVIFATRNGLLRPCMQGFLAFRVCGGEFVACASSGAAGKHCAISRAHSIAPWIVSVDNLHFGSIRIG